MRFIFLALFSFAFALGTVAQDSNFTEGELQQLRESLSDDYMISRQSRNVIGDPYLNEDFIKGFIQINDNAQTDILFLRLNIEKNVLEFARGKNYFGADSKKINGFTLLGSPENVVFKNGFQSEDNDINSTTLLRVVFEGKTSFVAHHTTSLKKNIATYGSATQKDEYVDDTKFYLVDPAGKLSEVKLKRKDILNALDSKSRKQVSDYAKQKDLDFSEEKDLKRIFEYYNELTEGA